MTVRRDHIAAIALLALGVATFLLGQELPFGTAASPGPGMLPFVSAGVISALAIVVFLGARSSPSFGTIVWDDLPHAVVVLIAAAAAAALYTTLGFPITIGILLFGLMFGIERMPLLTSLAITFGMTGGTYLLLGRLLKTPMPQGIFGF